MVNPQLGFYVDSSLPKLEVIRALSDAEHEEYIKSVALVRDLLSDYQQFEMVRNSYAEYRRLVGHYANKYSVRPQLNDIVKGEMNHAINRRLRSFFSEFRFFLDYAEGKLKRRYGKGSTQAKEFKTATSVQFDNSFAYRFVYQLRSYAQHVNLPINALSLESGEFDFLTATTKHNLLVEVDRDGLLNSGFDWRATDVKPQLKSLPSRFELNTYIEEMMECWEKIYVSFACIDLPEAKRGANFVVDLTRPIALRGTPCVYDLGTPKHAVMGQVYSGLTAKLDWVPLELAEFIAQLPDPEELAQYSQLLWTFKSVG